MKLSPTAEQERDFERKHVTKMKGDYLETDVVERYESDPGYRDKIDIMESFLKEHGKGGLNLDVGSNTAGEAEVLSHRGHRIVASDINEVALSVSLARAETYREKHPMYVAGDAHNLPFKDETFDSATAFEVLHHFENLAPALDEIYRVMKPGAHLFTFEPYGWNPYRRIAELRFYLIGSIEKSFTGKGLRKQLEAAGFEVESIGKKVIQPSSWRMAKVSAFKRFLVRFYHFVANAMVPVFGNLVVVARKPGESGEPSSSDITVEEIVRCPITKAPLAQVEEGYVSTEGEKRYEYGLHDGVPVIIEQDAKELSAAAE